MRCSASVCVRAPPSSVPGLRRFFSISFGQSAFWPHVAGVLVEPTRIDSFYLPYCSIPIPLPPQTLSLSQQDSFILPLNIS